MEANTNTSNQEVVELTIVVPSQEIQINSAEDEKAKAQVEIEGKHQEVAIVVESQKTQINSIEDEKAKVQVEKEDKHQEVTIVVEDEKAKTQVEIEPKHQEEVTIVVPSTKTPIDSIMDEKAKALVQSEDKYQVVTTIKLEGNSYSQNFFIAFGDILRKTKNIKNLNICDVFVSRGEEIPRSIQSISNGLQGINLLRLDISCNAVNPVGAAALLIYLKQASSLQTLIIFNCGLGPTGVAKIAEGLQGTPSLRTFSIARNRMKDDGILSIAESLKYVPLLQELFVYQNSLSQVGLQPLFDNLQLDCKQLRSLDVADNKIKLKATDSLIKLIKNNLNLRNLNISDCILDSKDSLKVMNGFKESKNRSWQKVGLNYCQLTQKSAPILVQVFQKCPLKKLDVVGNQLQQQMQQELLKAFGDVLSEFEDEDNDEEVTRLFEAMKIE